MKTTQQDFAPEPNRKALNSNIWQAKFRGISRMDSKSEKIAGQENSPAFFISVKHNI